MNLNPFTGAIAAAESFIVSFQTHVDPRELVKAAVIGAVEGMPGGLPGIEAGVFDSIANDLPNIVKPADQQMFLAALKLAEEFYQRLHGPAAAATSAPAQAQTTAPEPPKLAHAEAEAE